jgi:photosynthetic reaction center H subunit
MPAAAITSYIDVAQLVLYAFWIFFFGLIIYLRTEDKREGYPLDPDSHLPYERARLEGFWPVPKTGKQFLLHDGTIKTSGRPDTRPVAGVPIAKFSGAALLPTGNAMLDGIGAAAYALRSDVPDMNLDGHPKIVPLRVAPEISIEARDPDPRGMEVVGAYGKPAGVVKDVWVDRGEMLIRYLEVEVPTAGGSRTALLPMPLARIAVAPTAGGSLPLSERVIRGRRKQVRVQSILAAQFADVPALKHPDQVTLLEEDRISAYFGGGHRYANPARTEPLL